MDETKYEIRYLLAVLSSVLNQKKSPVSIRKLDWERIFKIADYHNVANVMYYGILGLGDAIPKIWQTRFYDKYQSTIIREELLKTEVGVLTWQLERNKIHSVFLEDTIMRNFYPYPEMHMVNHIEILVEREKDSQIAEFMSVMDYEKKEKRRLPGNLYTKVPGVPIIFHHKLSYQDKKLQQYFDTILERLRLEDGSKYIHEFSREEFFVYFISSLVQKYAWADIDIRGMIDLWVYYECYKEEIQWDYIEKELEKLKIKEFAERLLELTSIWFSGKNTEEVELYEAMESYIISKGTEGREESAKLIPLVKNVTDFYIRDYQKERIEMQMKWLFPSKEYMQSIYPVLLKLPIFLGPCWIIRLLRSLFYFVKGKMKVLIHKCWTMVQDLWKKIFKKKNK